MSTLRTVLIVAAAIVLAILALKVFLFVTGIIMMLATIVIFAAIIYALFLVARSVIGGRRAQQL
jgi:hypothetical protein